MIDKQKELESLTDLAEKLRAQRDMLDDALTIVEAKRYDLEMQIKYDPA